MRLGGVLSRVEQDGLQRCARAWAGDAVVCEGVAALEELDGGAGEWAHEGVFGQRRRRHFEIVQRLLDAEGGGLVRELPEFPAREAVHESSLRRARSVPDACTEGSCSA